MDFAKALQEEQKRKIHVDMKTVRTGVDRLNCHGIFSGMIMTSLWKDQKQTEASTWCCLQGSKERTALQFKNFLVKHRKT